MDLFTCWTDWKTIGIPRWNPTLSAERSYRLTGYCRFDDLLFLHIVGKAFVVARLELLLSDSARVSLIDDATLAREETHGSMIGRRD